MESTWLAMQQYMDAAEGPDRICAWCFYPRNSEECAGGLVHKPYVEMFADTNQEKQ